MRVKIISSRQGYRKGDIVDVSKNVAFGLIDSGVGIISKDITPDDYINKQETDNGKPTFVRPNKFK